MAYSPPLAIAWRIERASPGFWRDFVARANRATAGIPNLRLTSWWRSQAANVGATGAPDSQHLLGTAVDVAGELEHLELLDTRLAAEGFTTVRYRGHVHAQAWPAGVARQAGLLPL